MNLKPTLTLTPHEEKSAPPTLARSTFLLSSAHPGRWKDPWFRSVLDLQPLVCPSPVPHSALSKKVQRTADHFALSSGRIAESKPDEAYQIACDVMGQFFNRHTKTAKLSFGYVDDDLYDPGRAFHVGIRRAANILFVDNPDKCADDAERLGAIGAELLEFHKEHSTGSDVRFAPVRALGNFLRILAQVIRPVA